NLSLIAAPGREEGWEWIPVGRTDVLWTLFQGCAPGHGTRGRDISAARVRLYGVHFSTRHDPCNRGTLPQPPIVTLRPRPDARAVWPPDGGVGPALAKVNFLAKYVVRISPFGAMRRNGERFALLSACQRGHQTLLLRLSAVLRNAVAMWRPLITPDNCSHKTTWPEFQPSLPPGLVGCPCEEPGQYVDNSNKYCF